MVYVLGLLTSAPNHPPLEYDHLASLKYRCLIKISDLIKPTYLTLQMI